MLLGEEEYYALKEKSHGGSVESLGWSTSGQRTRFKHLLEDVPINLAQDSFLDVGCGYADLAPFFLNRSKVGFSQYFGIDGRPSVIEAAKVKHPEIPETNLSVVDLDLVNPGSFSVSWVFCSGALSFKDTLDTMKAIEKMWSLCTKGLCFNCLSDLKDPSHDTPDPVIWKDPAVILNFCLGLTRYTKFNHSYFPHDFTIQMFKDIQ
jgi:SAM-dependent methyltransferase